MIKKRNDKTRQRKVKSYLKWKLFKMPLTKKVASEVSKKSNNWNCKWMKAKILKANKHKIQEENTKTPWSKEMRNITKWPCSKKGDGGCEDLGNGT